MSPPPTAALAGIRVLELGSYISGPFACRLLADFGAEVVKIERPGIGDELRRWRLHEGDTSLLWRSLARNKKSVAIDLGVPRGRDLVLDLVGTCDIVVENFRPGTLERLGLGEDQLRRRSPELVLVRVSGYGQTGPYAGRPGFGAVAEAFGGLRHLTGYPDRPPTRVGISLADSLAGLHAAFGAVVALLGRQRHGQGELVDTALYESVFNVMESLLPDFDAYGVEPERTGVSMPGVVPSGTYATSDDTWVVISGNGDRVFPRLMDAVGRGDLASDPDLAGNTGRVAREDEIEQAIADWVVKRPAQEVLSVMEQAAVPTGPIYRASDIAEDPHYRARGMLERRVVDIGSGQRPVAFPGVVPRLRERPGRVESLGPELGEHTDEVLSRVLGLASGDIGALRREGVVA